MSGRNPSDPLGEWQVAAYVTTVISGMTRIPCVNGLSQPRLDLNWGSMTDRLLWVRSTGKVGAYGDQDSLQHFIMAPNSSSISCTRRPWSERGPTERIRQALRTSAAAVRLREDGLGIRNKHRLSLSLALTVVKICRQPQRIGLGPELRDSVVMSPSLSRCVGSPASSPPPSPSRQLPSRCVGSPASRRSTALEELLDAWFLDALCLFI